jgi:hypothetical protein
MELVLLPMFVLLVLVVTVEDSVNNRSVVDSWRIARKSAVV